MDDDNLFGFDDGIPKPKRVRKPKVTPRVCWQSEAKDSEVSRWVQDILDDEDERIIATKPKFRINGYGDSSRGFEWQQGRD